jgi:hypothetical protein
MGHGYHQQLPRRESESICIVCLLQPLSQNFLQTAIHVRTVGLDPIEYGGAKSQGLSQSLPLVSHIEKVTLHFKQVIDVCNNIDRDIYMHIHTCTFTMLQVH